MNFYNCLRAVCWKVSKKILTVLFSEVGLCFLVAGYVLAGAYMFQAIELPEEIKRQGHVHKDTENIAKEIVEYVRAQEALQKEQFMEYAEAVLKDYEKMLVYAINQEGYDGDDDAANDQIQWSLSGAVLYSITVLTTIGIGYGHIVPRTKVGKIATICYATVGIPLMLLCLASIAERMAQCLSFLYFRLCCSYCRMSERKRHQARTAELLKRLVPHQDSRDQAVGARSKLENRTSSSTTRSKATGSRSLTPSDGERTGSRGSRASRFSDMDELEIPTILDRGRRGSASFRLPRSPVQRDRLPRRSGSSRTLRRAVTMRSGYSGLGYSGRPVFRSRPQAIQRAASTRARRHQTGSKSVKTPKAPKQGMERHKTTVSLTSRRKANTGSGTSDDITIPAIVVHTDRVDSSGHIDAAGSDDADPDRSAFENFIILGISQFMLFSNSRSGHVRSTAEFQPGSETTTLQYKESVIRSLKKKLDDQHYHKMPTSVGILVVIGFIATGALLFSIWEEWNLFDGAYFCFVTLTTIGFGDLVPGKSLMQRSEEKLALCSVYLLLGMALIAMCFKLMQDDIVQKTIALGHKIGLLVWEYDSDEEDTLMSDH